MAADRRILIYSHDSFGLGHLRRCRAIAHALVEAHKGLSVLILSGSPIIGSFDFRARVDFVRVPGVIKLRNGEYTSLNLLIDIEQTLAMRGSIIRHTADIFDPDVFIVDKEPLGLRGEVLDTLLMLKARGTHLVLGLRDVLDESALLVPEWRRKRAMPVVNEVYDEIWVYGLAEVFDPLASLEPSPAVRAKTTFTGYLPRSVAPGAPAELPEAPYLLVTTGGGGDGAALIDAVLAAYESPRPPSPAAVLVLGPFMAPEDQARTAERVARLERVSATVFESHIEALYAGAAGVVAMGGYNTFCEILSFDKPALIVPRTIPRKEQLIRANRARELGLVDMLTDEAARDPATMAAALERLPRRPPPSAVVIPGLLDGFANLNRMMTDTLAARGAAPAARTGTA